MTDTNHTDSVEVSHLTDIAIEVWNQNCDKSAPEAMRAVVTALQAHTSQQVENWHKESFDRGLELGQQQVEEAVRKERERIISLAGGEPYIYVPNITEANSDTK